MRERKRICSILFPILKCLMYHSHATPWKALDQPPENLAVFHTDSLVIYLKDAISGVTVLQGRYLPPVQTKVLSRQTRPSQTKFQNILLSLFLYYKGLLKIILYIQLARKILNPGENVDQNVMERCHTLAVSTI